MQSSRDIPLIITSIASSSERRITPSWTIAQLKAKLEPVTGIPPTSQRLVLRTSDQTEQIIEATNEDEVQIWRWPLTEYAEIHVCQSSHLSCSEAWHEPQENEMYVLICTKNCVWFANR